MSEEPPSDMTIINPMAQAAGMAAKLIGQSDPVTGREYSCPPMAQVGRDPRAVSIYVNHPSISRCHAQFKREGANWVVEDRGSSNGVFVNGNRVQTAFLKDSDQVQFGDVKFEFKLVSAVQAPDKKKTMMQKLSDMTIFGGEVPKFLVDEIKEEHKEAEAGTNAEGKPVLKTSPETFQRERARKLFWVKVKVAVFAVLLLLVVGGGIYFMYRWVSTGKEILQAIKEFKVDKTKFEESSEDKVPSDIEATFGSQLQDLAEMRERGQEILKKFPGMKKEQQQELQRALGDLVLLSFERKLYMAIDKRDLEAVKEHIAALGKEATGEQGKLVPLLQLVAQFQIFRKRNPVGPGEAEVAPPEEEVMRLEGAQENLKTLYRDNNKALSTAKHLDRLADQTITEIIGPVKSWADFWTEYQTQVLKETDPAKKKIQAVELLKKYPQNAELRKLAAAP